MIHTEIKKMTVLERLQTMEELWDTLCQQENEMESPEWHKNILEERRGKIKKGETNLISLEELKTRSYK